MSIQNKLTVCTASITTLLVLSSSDILEWITACLKSLMYSEQLWSLMPSIRVPRNKALRRPRAWSQKLAVLIVPLHSCEKRTTVPAPYNAHGILDAGSEIWLGVCCACVVCVQIGGNRGMAYEIRNGLRCSLEVWICHVWWERWQGAWVGFGGVIWCGGEGPSR